MIFFLSIQKFLLIVNFFFFCERTEHDRHRALDHVRGIVDQRDRSAYKLSRWFATRLQGEELRVHDVGQYGVRAARKSGLRS